MIVYWRPPTHRNESILAVLEVEHPYCLADALNDYARDYAFDRNHIYGHEYELVAMTRRKP